jgi:putative zinc finger protein
MSCQTVLRSLSAFVDQDLAEKESSSVSRHLARCRDCATRSQELAGMRRLLRDLPMRPVPEKLSAELQVMASHDRARRSAYKDRWRRWGDWFSLLVDNLMRPIAIPFAGGLVSAVFLFSMLTPTLTIRAAENDVPASWWLYTEASIIQTAPFGFHSDEVEVELTIDRNGQITDYSCPNKKLNRELIDNIGNNLLFSMFKPATMLGQPISGKIRVSFKKVGDHIVVRG